MAGVVGDATTAFFDGLARQGGDPRLRKARGTVRFDLVHGRQVECRYVTIDRGAITVSRKRGSADGVIRVERALFDRMASGELNPVAAVLRGDLAIDGDWRLLVLVQRLFPGPPAPSKRPRAGYAKRAE